MNRYVPLLEEYINNKDGFIDKTGKWYNKKPTNLHESLVNNLRVPSFYEFYTKINEELINEENELDSIKNSAIENNTFMKSPNGNPTNLNEKQWLQVRTKAFKDWFGDWENDTANASKVIDENGEPMIVYHGTMEPGFTIFKQWQKRKGFYFTEKKGNAEAYGELYEVFLNIRNPKIYDFKGNKWNYPPMSSGVKSTDDAVNKTDETIYDATIIENVIDSGGYSVGVDNDYVVFNSNQIKSATDNNGFFSPESDNIYECITK